LGIDMTGIPPHNDSESSEEFVPFPSRGESRGIPEDYESQPERQAKRPKYDK